MMNLSGIKDISLFHTFCHLFQPLFEPLSHGQCDQKEAGKSVQKLKKSNKPFNFG